MSVGVAVQSAASAGSSVESGWGETESVGEELAETEPVAVECGEREPVDAETGEREPFPEQPPQNTAADAASTNGMTLTSAGLQRGPELVVTARIRTTSRELAPPGATLAHR